MTSVLSYRSIFLSDIHLGTRDAKTQYLLDFLQHTECEYLYLVGDIFDLWKLKKGWHWPQINNELVAHVFAMARKGTKVIYIPGNHDEMFRDYCGGNYNGVLLQRDAEHTGANGRKYLVLHGDEFDYFMRHNKWLAHVGDKAYDFLLWLNHWFNMGRRRLGFGYWSLSAYLKHQTKNAVNFIGNYEKAVCSAAQHHNVDGVICGHIHHAAIEELDGCEYKNSGDWVESCTALVEDHEGAFQIIRWAEQSTTLLDEMQPKHSEQEQPAIPTPRKHAA
jgi:UDP-2,3-diacylglucosamine pyrophosphatase LpxH